MRNHVTGLMAIVLVTLAGAANAAVPTEVTDGFTALTTDFGVFLGLAIALAVAVRLGFISVKWLKKIMNIGSS